MAQGTFILSVKPTGAKAFGELCRYTFDDLALRKVGRRDGVLSAVDSSLDGWRTRYAPYSTAEFRIEESEAYSKKRKLIYGPRYTPAEARANS